MKKFFAYLFFVFCQLPSANCYAQQSKLDSLLSLLKTAKEDTNKLNIISQLSEECATEDILKYAELALKLSEKLSTSSIEAVATAGKNGIANAFNNIGFVNMNNGEIPKALEYYRKSLKLREEVGNKSGIAVSINNIGFIYNNQGDIESALEWFIKGLKIQEEIGDKKGMATLLNNIGLIYNNQGDIPKALEWFLKALKIQQEIGDKKASAATIINLGVIHMRRGHSAGDSMEIKKALEFYEKGLKIDEEIGDKRGMAYALHNIGYIYEREHRFQNALEFYHKSLKFREETGDKHGITFSLNNIGGIYFQEKKYSEAENYCERSLQIAQEMGYPENIRNASNLLSKIYKAIATSDLASSLNKMNYLNKALEMHELFKTMADSINNVETRKSGLKKQMQYDFEKKEAQTKAEQEKKDIIANEELQKQKVVRNSFIGGFALVLILALVVFRSYRQKQKANIEISKQKHVIEEKQKEILDSIHYAKRIQTALITNEKYIHKSLNKLMPN